MTVDVKIMLLMVVVWIVMAILWSTVIVMPEGARAWSMGAIVMSLVSLAVFYAERRGRRRGGKIE